MQFTYPAQLQPDAQNQWARPLHPPEVWDKIYEQCKQNAVGYLCSYDPSHAELYRSMLPEADRLLPAVFKEVMREFCAGAFDPESALFKMMMRNVCFKLANCLRFFKECELYRAELDRTRIAKPMFVVSLPRSGSTYLHTMLASNPKAKTIKFYEHLAPGSRTMTCESRRKMISDVLGTFHTNATEINALHAIDSIDNPEEELFFMESMGNYIFFANAIPRLEAYRLNHDKKDWHWCYEALLDEMRMHCVEFPLDDGEFLCMKAVFHFYSMIPFFDVLGNAELDARFVWIHRDPVDSIRSMIPLFIQCKGRFEHDIGHDDFDWVNRNSVNVTEYMLRNALATREHWIKQDPQRAQQICDVSFKQAVSEPFKTINSIYEYFGMPLDKDAEEHLRVTIAEGDPQRKFGRKRPDASLFTFDEEKTRERFKFYYDAFGHLL